MEIQQHDGVVVEVAGSRQGFAKRKRGGRGVTGGREAPGLGVLLPCASPLYIGVGGLVSFPPSPLGRWQRWGKEIPSFPSPSIVIPRF